MNNTTDTATPAPDPALGTDEKTRSIQWMLRLLICVAALTIAADILTYGFVPGLGWALFAVLLWVGIVWNRDLTGYQIRGKDIALVVMLALSAFQMLNRPSFSNALVVGLLTIYLAGHTLYQVSPWWQRFAHSLSALCLAPLRWFQTAHWFSAIDWKIKNTGKSVQKLSKLAIIVLPSVVFAGVFLVLLGSGNAVLGDAVTRFFDGIFRALEEIELPSIVRVFFWGFMATLALGLLWRSTPSKGLKFITHVNSKNRVLQLADPSTAIWATRMLLISVNAVFFAANTIDVVYLWNEAELPRELTLSQFVHKGTHNLILSVILAAVIIGFLFSQNRQITRARGQRFLAFLWILQNLMLVSSVLLRLKMYVDGYHLTLLRIHLALFLVLVVIGFVLLTIRVMKERSITWLFGANLLASFLLFFCVQFWDTRKFVAEYNVQVSEKYPDKELDVYYLTELGPSAWPVLVQLAEQDSGRHQKDALAFLKNIETTEAHRARFETWQEFRLHQNRMRQLIGVEVERDSSSALAARRR